MKSRTTERFRKALRQLPADARADDTIVWYWIGSHGDYDTLLTSL